jgi:hypothetical protein
MSRVRKEITRANERKAWRLRVLRGCTQQQIADELEIDISTVSRMLGRVEERLERDFADLAIEEKRRQTEALLHVADEAFAEWERSKLAATANSVTSGRASVTRDGDVIELPDLVVRTRKGRIGDHNLLARAMDAYAAIRKIWGLDAPEKRDLTSNGQSIAPVIGYVITPPEGANAGTGDTHGRPD